MLGFLKRRGWLLLGLAAAGALTLTYLERQREQIFEHWEWQSLTRTLAALDADPRPAQAGVFISAGTFERYLSAYVGLQAQFAQRWPQIEGTTYATIEKIDVQGGKGLMTAKARMRFADMPYDVHLAVLFNGLEPVTRMREGQAERHWRATFKAVPVVTAPHTGPGGILSWWDRGHTHVNAATEAAAALFDAARGVQVDLPAEIVLPLGLDQISPLEFRQTGSDGRDVVAGAMKLQTSLPAASMRRELYYSAPVFIGGGVALLAHTKAATPSAAAPSPARPDLDSVRRQLPDLRWRFEAVTRQISVAGKDFEMWFKKPLLGELLAEVATLSDSQRRILIEASEPSGIIHEANDTGASAYRMTLSPGRLAGTAQLHDLRVTAPPDGEVRLAGQISVQGRAVTTAHWDSWLLPAPGSYELPSTVTGSAALQGSLTMFTATVGTSHGAYLGLALSCTPVVVEAASEQGRVAKIGPFRHGVVRTRVPLRMFEQKARAGALIRSDVQRVELLQASAAEPSDTARVRLTPRARAIDVAWLADDAGARGDEYRISGRISLSPSLETQFTAEEKRVLDDLSKVAITAEPPGEHACPPLTASQTTIEDLTADPPEAALGLLLGGPARAETDKLRTLNLLKQEGRVPVAAMALVEGEIAAVTRQIETAIGLARRAKAEADRQLEEARRKASEAAERLERLMRELPELEQQGPRQP
jgi:hypothetical protein